MHLFLGQEWTKEIHFERIRGWSKASSQFLSAFSSKIIPPRASLSIFPQLLMIESPKCSTSCEIIIWSVCKILFAMESTERVAQPRSEKNLRAVDFPEAIPPVSPTTSFPRSSFIENNSAHLKLASKCVNFKVGRLSSCQHHSVVHNDAFLCW